MENYIRRSCCQFLLFMLLILMLAIHVRLCEERETIFHCFTECLRLQLLFNFLQFFFNKLNESFNIQKLSWVIDTQQRTKRKSQLLKFF